jgi:hypothetical protein
MLSFDLSRVLETMDKMLKSSDQYEVAGGLLLSSGARPIELFVKNITVPDSN